MYMSKMVLTADAAVRMGVYDVHQALWDAFSDSPDRRRDFLYRALEPGRVGFGRAGHGFLVVSSRPPQEQGTAWRAQVKEYAPRLAQGERVLFSLRVNPVRKTRDQTGRQVRHDLVQDERMRLTGEGVTVRDIPSRLALAQLAGERWMTARAPGMGLELEPDTLMAEAYQRHGFRKRRGGREVVVSMMDLRGFARVTDPAALERALFKGVGPAKAFGCGLLLVRRA